MHQAPSSITIEAITGGYSSSQVCATLPDNYIAFEYPTGNPTWWYDIVEGLPDPIVVDGHIAVGSRPGMGLDFIVDRARAYLQDEDKTFFD